MSKIICTIFTCLLSFVGLNVYADFDRSTKIPVGSLYYYLDDENGLAEVTSVYNGKYTGDIDIPSRFIYNNKEYCVNFIGASAFSTCTGLLSVSIPNSVTSIGPFAFSGCTGLMTLTLPNSITNIGVGSFMSCENLKFISIPEGLTNINALSFYGCSSLTSFTIPNSVTSIGGEAFESCTALTSITIPADVSRIDNFAFSWCTALSSIIVEAGNIVYDSRNNCNAIIQTETNTLIKGCQSTIIPNSVTSINDFAFDNCIGLKTFSIPEGVTSIGKSAFWQCTNLTSVSIPESVYSIGNAAFEGCKSLVSIKLPESITIIGDSTFRGCNSLTAISIPDGITSIGEEAFLNCMSLTSLIIPNNVERIGDYAFYGCSNLTTVQNNNKTPIDITQYVFTNREKATLIVPIGSKVAYENSLYWSDFKEIMEDNFNTGLNLIFDDIINANQIYTIGGNPRHNSKKGVIIIRMKDGKTKKVIIQ